MFIAKIINDQLSAGPAKIIMNVKNFVINFRNRFFYKLLEVYLSDCNSVLDVGCGFNSAIGRVRKTFYSEGIDIYKPSIDISKKNKIHDNYKLGNIKTLEKYYKQKSFDAVIALDVVEHLDKKDAIELMEKMEKIARKKVIILTPNGFFHHARCNDENIYQQHRSGWYPNDYKKRGYKVYGLWGLKAIRSEDAAIKYKPKILWSFVVFITEPILYYFPNVSFDIFAIKTFDKQVTRR